MMCRITCLRRALLAHARALILRMHTSTESCIIPPDVVACRIACLRSVHMRTCAARVCAQRGMRYCKSAARCAGARFSSMPAQFFCSGLVKIGQADDRGCDARARPGALGGAERGALILPGGAGRGALVSAPQRPCQP